MSATSDATVYRPGFNPEFLARARERNERETRQREIQELKEMREREAERRRREMVVENLKAKNSVASLLSQYRELELTYGKKSVRQIILEVALKYNISPDAITGRSRAKNIIPARHEAIWRARYERPDLSLPQIGKVFDRDHTSCLAAIRKIDRQRAGK